MYRVRKTVASTASTDNDNSGLPSKPVMPLRYQHSVVWLLLCKQKFTRDCIVHEMLRRPLLTSQPSMNLLLPAAKMRPEQWINCAKESWPACDINRSNRTKSRQKLGALPTPVCARVQRAYNHPVLMNPARSRQPCLYRLRRNSRCYQLRLGMLAVLYTSHCSEYSHSVL